MNARPFVKMHGLGNDVVIVDARAAAFPLDAAAARWIADRRRGVGCDQIVVIEPPANPRIKSEDRADVFLRFYNADGGEAEACGNGTRCAAALLMGGSGARQITMETLAGRLAGSRAADGRVSVDMGPAKTEWREIPLARACDTLHLDLSLGPLNDPVAVNMGNPHAVFFVPDVAAIDIEALGPKLEHDPLFPERANIGIAQLTGPDRLRLRVWERGAGLTLACGSGACAAAVAAVRRGLTGRTVTLDLDGGPIEITWREADGHVLMTGPVATAFTGTLDLDAQAQARA
jgi:diaminopimelate epimerase